MEDLSRELREMSERRGYGSLPCSPEESLRYLFTVDDQHIHNSALSIYSCYRELTGRYEAMLELTQGFADLSGKSFQIMKCDGTAHPDEHERRNCA